MRNIWKLVAWVFTICGLIAYLAGWFSLLTGISLWNLSTDFWFYDAIATGIFGIFFLIYSREIE